MKNRTTPSTFTTDSEEEDLSDTTLQQLDALLANYQPPAQPKSPEDAFFDEIAEMLKNSDRDSAKIVVAPETDNDEYNADDFFDQILKEIPKDQLKSVHWHDDIPSEELRAEIDKMEGDLAKIDAQIYEENKKAAYIRKVQSEISDPAYIEDCLMRRKGMERQQELDKNRIAQHLTSITALVKQLSIWSPAKNAYTKILKNKSLSTYDKVQQLIKTASDITKRNSKKKTGFLIEGLTRKAYDIHAAIAEIDVNSDISPKPSRATLAKI